MIGTRSGPVLCFKM